MIAAFILIIAFLGLTNLCAAEWTIAAQKFKQEIATRFTTLHGLPKAEMQLIEISTAGTPRAFGNGRWFELRDERWQSLEKFATASENEFIVADQSGTPVTLSIPWREVRQVLRSTTNVWIATAADPFLLTNGRARSLGWPSRNRVNQIAVGPDGRLWVASSGGLFQQARDGRGWSPLGITDGLGRGWGVLDVLGVAFDKQGQLWFAIKAGVGCRTANGWRFFEGKDGLPWNEFTGITASPDSSVWFGTKKGAIRFDGTTWHTAKGLPGCPMMTCGRSRLTNGALPGSRQAEASV
jgi:hypothetical protein